MTTTKTKTRTKTTTPELPANQCRVLVGPHGDITGFACWRTAPDGRCAFETVRLSCREPGQFRKRLPRCLSDRARIDALVIMTLKVVAALKNALPAVRA
jgi:hypothetical protein